MDELRVTAREAGPPTCLYCRDAVEAPTVCDRCDATYHADCRAELGRCATPGCAGAGRRAAPVPEFARDWRTTARQAQAEWRAAQAEEQERRARAVAPRTRPRIESGSTATPALVVRGGAGLALAALLAVTVYAFLRPGAQYDPGRFYTPLGVLAGPVAVAITLRAVGGSHPAARRAGWAMLVTLLAGASCAPIFDVWWHLPTFVFGAAFAALLVGASVGGDEPVPPR